MQVLLRQTWQDALPAIRERLGSAEFQGWIAGLRPLRMERGVYHLEAPSRLASERVQRLYAGAISDCLTDVFGTRVDVLVQPPAEALMPDRLEVAPTEPVIDASNRTAALVLQALAEGRELAASLFCLHGPVGVGKTFLLDWWRRAWPGDGRPMYFDGDRLLRAFQAAVRDRRADDFSTELTDPGRPLVLDELHRVSGRKKLQECVLRVLQERVRTGASTVLASRWHPHEIWDLDPTLATWLLSGFVTKIEPPGPAGRLRFLRALEGGASGGGRGAWIERLAREAQGGYPELRRLWARHRTSPELRTFQLIEPRTTFDRVCARVVEGMDVVREELLGPGQKRRVSRARQVLAWLCVREGLSRAEVGRYLRRTRAAISYAVQTIDAAMQRDPELRKFVESL